METKPNEGVIFRNKKKQDGDKQPDWKGEIDCKGVKQEIALWHRTAASGVDYFSVKLSDPWVKKEAEPPQGTYERTGKFDKVPAKLDEQPDREDDTPTDTDQLPF